MKLWLINQYALNYGEPGSTRHIDFTTELLKHGIETKIFTSDFNHYNHEYVSKESQEKLSPVKFKYFHVPPYQGNGLKRIVNMLVYSAKILSLLFTPKNKCADRILASSPHLFGAFAGLILAKIKGIPFTLEVRDIWPMSIVLLGNHSEKSLPIQVFSFIEKMLYMYSDSIITLLPDSINYMASIRGNSENIFWIPNGVISDNHSLKEVDSHKTTIVYAGSHSIANDIETLIYAASKLDPALQVEVKLYGEGKDKPDLIKLVKDLNLDSISFFESVPKSQIPAVLGDADALWLGMKNSKLYQYGVSPNKLFDYMAAGKPIIYSGADPNPLVNKYACGISCKAECPDSLASVIAAFVKMSKEEKLKLGENGRKAAVGEFDLKVLGAKLANVLRS